MKLQASKVSESSLGYLSSLPALKRNRAILLVGEGRFELPISCFQGTRLKPARPLPDMVATPRVERGPCGLQPHTLPSSSVAVKFWWTVRESNSHLTGAGRG